MNLDTIKKRIGAFLSSDKRWPVVVDFPTKDDLADFIDFFSIGENSFLSADSFCREDGTFKLEEFIDSVGKNEGNTFVVGLTAFLKLQGEDYTQSNLKTILSKTVSGHLVIVTYKCKNQLRFADSRFSERGQIYIADGDADSSVEICLINPDLAEAFPNCYNGFEHIGRAYETKGSDPIYIATDVSKDNFSKAFFNISQLSNSYDILCGKDSRTKTVLCNFGTNAQWNLALKLIGCGDWTSIVDSEFGGSYNLSDLISRFNSFDDNKKWLYFICMHIFGVPKNTYLRQSVFNSAKYSELIKSLFRTILLVDYKQSNFEQLYSERKEILRTFDDALEEAVDYCKVISVKEEDAIYYLTDLTQPEKERIIDWLSTYGDRFSPSQLEKILRRVYPDLADYLSLYRFKNTLLDSYFENYKYQKLINKILPTFELVVDEQSKALSFLSVLPARTAIVDKLNLSKAHAYFFDALGVEYLGYIQAKCHQYGLSANITCGRCELPSLTCCNKEFVSTLNDKGCAVSDIKSLDEIKHHGEDTFDYEKVKTPVYLIKELEIIDDLLKKIRASILGGQFDKAVIISDHGASRLAVLHETENLWRMATSGVHSGRCCPKNELDSKPDFAIETDDFWVLPNYDRFQGGRKANVEVHGGATLEEVAVPIIEITRKPSHVEAFITDGSKVVMLGAKEYPVIKIFVGIDSHNLEVRVGDKYYDVKKTTDEYLYVVELLDVTKKGIYTMDILNGNDVIASKQVFEIKKKGMGEVNLFD